MSEEKRVAERSKDKESRGIVDLSEEALGKVAGGRASDAVFPKKYPKKA